MPVPSLIAIGRFHKAKRARLYAEEEVIILIVLAEHASAHNLTKLRDAKAAVV